MNVDPELNGAGIPVRCFCGALILRSRSGRPRLVCSQACYEQRRLELRRKSDVAQRWRELANERARLNHPTTIRPGYDGAGIRRYVELRPISSIQLPGNGFGARTWNALRELASDDRTG